MKNILEGINIKKSYLITLFILFSFGGVYKAQYFEQSELITTGVYYYPEHWPADQWERDIKNIAEFGFEFIHMTEFAWVFMEPMEGVYEFEWLDKVISLAEKYDLKVVLSTPSPCPPAWLSLKHPELYLDTDIYQRIEHGARGNASTSSRLYQEYLKKIVTQLAKRYGENKNVIGWQIDNEPNALDDFSNLAQVAFRQWLKEKYITIENLNDAWGNKFWGVIYDNFEQIRIPNKRLLYGPSPTALLDHIRFRAFKQAEFLDNQALTLRKYINKNQWITTNYIKTQTRTDPRMTKAIDFSSYTIYPVSGITYNLGENGYRIGEYNTMAFANDFYRSINGTTGVMELQPGQVNWGPYNPIPEPGAIRMWLWHAFAGGCSFACTYRYRQPLYGSEQYHYGIVGTDGVTLSPGGKEYQQYMSEIRKLRSMVEENDTPVEIVKNRTAILFERDNYWDAENQKRSDQWDTQNYIYKYMDAIKSFGAPLDFITENEKFAEYPYLIVPAYQMVDQELIERWKRYAEQGGNLIITCRSGHKDRNSHLWEAKWAEPIYDLIGAEIEAYDVLLPEIDGITGYKNKDYIWHTWGDILNPRKGTETLAVHKKHFYKGKTSATRQKLGKGVVTYIGIDSDDGKLEKDILRDIYLENGSDILDLPKGVYVEYRNGFWVAVNYSSETFELDIPIDSEIIYGKKSLSSPGVTVWKN